MPTQQYPVVLRFEGLRPEQLSRYIMHLKRNGGDLAHVDEARSYLNKQLIGDANWAADALAKIDDMRMHNHADELERLQCRRRTKELKQRMLEGPKDPWRPTKHGPMRELILTANADWFEDAGDQSTFRGMLAKRRREKAFERCAVAWLTQTFGEDVIHARADRDEKTYHIQAVIMLRDRDRHGRRVLRPSKFPEIEDYELAQDKVGTWFAQVGLTRGERRAHQARQARAHGKPVPKKVRHKRTAQWRKEQDMKLAMREERLLYRDAEVTSREAEASAILAVADDLACGDFEIIPDDTVPQGARIEPAAQSPDPKRQDETELRMFFSYEGTQRAVASFARALGRLQKKAEADAHARLEATFRQIESIRSDFAEILPRLSPKLKDDLKDTATSIASGFAGLKRLLQNREKSDLNRRSSNRGEK